MALDRRGQIAVAPDGTLYFAEVANHRVRKIGPDGILRTAAGSGPAPDSQGFGAFSGDGGPALQARLSRPQGVTLGPDGSVYIADSCNQRVRKVTPDGIITTVAGSGLNCQLQTPKFGGDGGPATSAGLAFPFFSLAVASDSTLFIADFPLATIRRVTPQGVIDTVAGNGFIGGIGSGVPTCTGNNCPAPATALGKPESVALGPAGELYAGLGDSMFRIARIFAATAKRTVTLTNILVPSSDASEVYVFDSRGRHLRTLDALTNAQLQLFAYDSAGRLTSITDRDGNVTTVQRDAQGNPTAIVGPYGQQTTITADSNGYLHTVTNPNSEMVQLLYKPVVAGDPHTGGLLTQYTNARGGQSLYEYDSDGFLTKDTPPDGSFVTLDRGGVLGPTSVTYRTALGRTKTYGISRSPTDDMETRTSRDTAGLLTTVKRNPDQSTSVTQPDGTSVTSTLSPDPRFGIQAPIATTTMRTPSGLTRTETRSRTVSLSNPNDPLSLTSLIEQVTVNGRTSRNTYEASAKTITQVSPMGRQTVTAFDAQGRVTQVQSAGVLPRVVSYDPRGRPQTITQGTRTTSVAYRSDGLPGSILDPLLQSTSLAYDLAGRPTSVTLPDSAVLGMTYDANGNLTSVTPPGRPAHGFTYTAGDQDKEYTPPDVGQPRITHTDYNLDQQVSSVSRPDGEIITPTYDTANGRLTAVTTSRGTNTYAYSSGTGQLSSITTFDGVGLSYGYNGSLLKDITWSGPVSGNVHKTYDSNFRLSSEAVTGGQTVNFGYDNDDLLTSAGALTLTRDPVTDSVTATTLGAISETRTYDAYGAEQTYMVTANGTTLYSVDYGTRDGLARITNKTETIQGETHAYGYTYDANGRLTSVTKDGATSSHYEYDANGNRTVGPGLTASPVYDNHDRLLSYGNCTYTYKPDGSLQARTCLDGTTTYDYDAFGNLRRVTLPTATKVDYLIDGQNRRIGKRINGTLVESFVYEDDLRRVGWYDETGSLRAQFAFRQNKHVPDVMIKAGQTYKLVYDQAGSIREVVASNGTIAERVDYDEFGNIISDSAPGFQPYGFAGGLRDVDTGLIRFGARDYDTVIGRWVSKDPLLFKGGSSNVYEYVHSDPVNYIDPAGLGEQFNGGGGGDSGGAGGGRCDDGQGNWGACPPQPPLCEPEPFGPWLNKCLNACALGTEYMQNNFCSKLYRNPQIYAMCMAAAAAGEVACNGFCFARWGKR